MVFSGKMGSLVRKYALQMLLLKRGGNIYSGSEYPKDERRGRSVTELHVIIHTDRLGNGSPEPHITDQHIDEHDSQTCKPYDCSC